jgi:hypothetical protein
VFDWQVLLENIVDTRGLFFGLGSSLEYALSFILGGCVQGLGTVFGHVAQWATVAVVLFWLLDRLVGGERW